MQKNYLFLPLLFLTFFTNLHSWAEEAPGGFFPKVIELGDVTISCEAYEKYHKDLFEAVDATKGAYSHALIQLNDRFGTYHTGRIISSSNIQSKNGLVLPVFSYVKNIDCQIDYKYEDVYVGIVKGKKVFEKIKVASFNRKNVNQPIRNGYVDHCNIWVAHSMDMKINDCGVGKIIRYFDVKMECGKSSYLRKYSQTINVVATCSFSDAVLEVPKTQEVCGPIKHISGGRVEFSEKVKPVTINGGWASACGESPLVKSYTDMVMKIQGADRQFLVVRSWTFEDYCTGKKLTADQKIRVDGTCGDPEPEPDPKPDPKPDPEDKDPYIVSQKLPDLEISIEKYEMIYKDVVDNSVDLFRMGKEDLSSGLLNTIFGSYEVAGKKVDPGHFNLYTQLCEEGMPQDTALQKENGMIRLQCSKNVNITQVLGFVSGGDCGERGLERRFIVEAECGKEKTTDTLVQKIRIVSPCPLTASQFVVPADTTICEILGMDDDGNYLLPALDDPEYMEADRKVLKSDYSYTITFSSQKPYVTHVERQWTYMDTCALDSVVLRQFIDFVDTCDTGEYVMAQAMPTRGKMVRVSKTGQNVMEVQMDEEGRVKMGEPEPVEAEDVRLEPERANHDGDEVYPNPFSQNVNLEFRVMQSGPVNLEILDANGRSIYRNRYDMEQGFQKITLSRDKFQNPGVYIIQMTEEDRVWNRKVVFQ